MECGSLHWGQAAFPRHARELGPGDVMDPYSSRQYSAMWSLALGSFQVLGVPLESPVTPRSRTGSGAQVLNHGGGRVGDASTLGLPVHTDGRCPSSGASSSYGDGLERPVGGTGSAGSSIHTSENRALAALPEGMTASPDEIAAACVSRGQYVQIGRRSQVARTHEPGQLTTERECLSTFVRRRASRLQ